MGAMRAERLGLPGLAAVALGVPVFARPSQPCFAFLLRGDVTAVCQGRTTQITHRGDIEDFAVSAELSRLAYVTSQVISVEQFVATSQYTASVVNLKTGEIKKVEGVDGVVATCGAIMPNQIGARNRTLEVVTGADVGFEPYVRFRCSSDRRVVAGVTPTGDLYEGVPPAVRLAGAADVYPHYFNVSPDGSKIAWFNDDRPLCVLARGGGMAECIEHSTIRDPVSVADSGEMLVATGTLHGCVYKTFYDFSPAPDGKFGDDECLGIGYWKPGMKSIVFLRPIGRNPQWLSPDVAGLLRRWAVRSTAPARR